MEDDLVLRVWRMTPEPVRLGEYGKGTQGRRGHER
jgi:hypothetical protein